MFNFQITDSFELQYIILLQIEIHVSIIEISEINVSYNILC